MPKLICANAQVICSGSVSPIAVPYSVLPGNGVAIGDSLVATREDWKPLVNIGSFGSCQMQGTPIPCTPSFAAPFMGVCPSVRIGGSPVLSDGSSLVCARGGIVKFHSPGQGSIEVP